MKREMLILSVPFIFLGAFSQAQEEFPRTPSGRPDFSGHYDISTLTPFERPTSFGSRQSLNEDEVNALREREMGIRARDAESSDPNREAPEAVSYTHLTLPTKA